MTSGRGKRAPATSLAPEFAFERVIGASHVRNGKPCQDEAGVWAVADIVAVALADGHGSSKHAEVGARIAVQVCLAALADFAERLADGDAALAAIQRYADHPLRVQLVREWAARVRRKAGDDDVDLVDYGSTVLFALATDRFLLLGQLGDGDILLIGNDGSVRVPLPADPAAFADETPSLCLPEAWQSLRVLVLPAPDAEALLLLSTDGYSKSYARDADFRQIGPDYLELIRADGVSGLRPHLRGFLEQVTTGGSGDDIALGLLYWPHLATEADETAPVGSEATSQAEETTKGVPQTAQAPDAPPSDSGADTAGGEEPAESAARSPAGAEPRSVESRGVGEGAPTTGGEVPESAVRRVPETTDSRAGEPTGATSTRVASEGAATGLGSGEPEDEGGDDDARTTEDG